MKKLLLLITCLFLFVASNAQLQFYQDTLHVAIVGDDSLFSFNGFAPSGLAIEIDFTAVDAFDATVTFAGSDSKIDTLYGAWDTPANPVQLNLTNYPDSICRVVRTIGHFLPSLEMLVTSGSVTAGTKLPVRIYSDRF